MKKTLPSALELYASTEYKISAAAIYRGVKSEEIICTVFTRKYGSSLYIICHGVACCSHWLIESVVNFI